MTEIEDVTAVTLESTFTFIKAGIINNLLIIIFLIICFFNFLEKFSPNF